jgi:hypothetical protein
MVTFVRAAAEAKTHCLGIHRGKKHTVRTATLGGGITEPGQQETKNTLSEGIDVSRNVVTLVRVATEAKTHWQGSSRRRNTTSG